MQLLRHAFIDVLQRSQRYVKEDGAGFVIPEAIASNPEALELYTTGMEQDQIIYDKLWKLGIRAEDARYKLANGVHTQMVLTGNFQAWWDFLHGNAGRLQKAAQWEVREVAQNVQNILRLECPNIFGLTNGE